MKNKKSDKSASNGNGKNNGNGQQIKQERIYVGKKDLSHKMADGLARAIGSWKFLIIQSIILVFWIIINIVAFFEHWDPYPFILLNLTLSLQAAYSAPVILMSQNREAEIDRRRAMNDLAVDRRTERKINEVESMILRVEKKVDELRRSQGRPN